MGRGGASHASAGRRLARSILAEARARDAYVRELVDARRGSAEVPDEDFRFAQVLVFGVTMCAGVLDEAIDAHVSPGTRIKPKLRDCLRISAYELLFLGKPAHVAVDQGVELVKDVAAPASGLANAVLHKLARAAGAFPWGDVEADDVALARSTGLPGWLMGRLIADHGRSRAASIAAACLQQAPTYLVDNPFGGEPFASDLSAQQVASLVALDAPLLELGAGRGTKTVQLQARALRELGRTLPACAVDLHEYRCRLLDERMAACGINCVGSFVGDARDLGAIEGLPSSFPSVLVDAPCSGTGTLRRHPEIRWRLLPGDVSELARLQLELLCSAASRTSAGGCLVYATCSILREENQGVVERFLASDEGSSFELLPATRAELIEGQDASSITPEGFFASLPALAGPDGHFAARLRRRA